MLLRLKWIGWLALTTAAGAQADFEGIARPYFDQHCVACHGSKKEKGDLNLETGITDDFENPTMVGKWEEILNAVNSHEMPPEDEPQPSVTESTQFSDWLHQQLVTAEKSRRSGQVVLRRMNRAEYAGTMRDLLGVTIDPDEFPEDAKSDGFDNVGSALSLSPLLLEKYYEVAERSLSEVIVHGEKPESQKWHFEPEEAVKGMDRDHIMWEGRRLYLNKGNNQVDDGAVVMRTAGWDKSVNIRPIPLKHPGRYVIRFRAASRVPSREVVVTAMEPILEKQLLEQSQKSGRPIRENDLPQKLQHFREDRMYQYGPGRLQTSAELNGQPVFSTNLDIDAIYPDFQIYEVPVQLEAAEARVDLLSVYSIPKVLENFWIQGRDEFPRPEVLVDWFELEGPIYQEWPPEPHQRLFNGLAGNPDSWGMAEAKQVLERFMPKVWRRPIEDAELAPKLAMFETALADKGDFLEAIKVPLIATLISPHFLFLAEPREEDTTLDDFELATRLSYFLWSSMPDTELTKLAAEGKLTDPAVLAAQVNRMLKDPKNDAFAKNFAEQWLNLRDIGLNPPAPDLFPRYDRHLEESMAAESVAFFREILQKDESVLSFVKSDFVVINERLARFYDIPGVKGDTMRRVEVPEGIERGGIVTMASILCTTSNGTRTSPVVRGTWILRNLLDSDPGLPIANVGEISPKVPGIDKATVRQRLQIHREMDQCARCHDKIDPLGFALENFNAAGEWRWQEGFGYQGRIEKDDPVIDASAKMPDGTEFVGVSGLQNELLRNEDLFLRCLTKKMMTYALGRQLGYADDEQVAAAVRHLKANNYQLRALIHFIVNSETFRQK